MTKLIHLGCLLCFVVSLTAQDVSKSFKTYTVSVKKLTTSFENVLIESVPKFNIPDYQNVASNGDYQLNIEFTKGLMTKQLITRKETNRTFYHKPYYDSPAYTLTITDLAGKLLFENNYGGSRASIDWGKSQKFTSSDAAYQVWREEREEVWKALELKSVDLTKLTTDVITFFDSLKPPIEKIDLADTSSPIPQLSDIETPKPDEQKKAKVLAKKKTTPEKTDTPPLESSTHQQAAIPTKKKTTPSEKIEADNLLIKLVGSVIN